MAPRISRHRNEAEGTVGAHSIMRKEGVGEARQAPVPGRLRTDGEVRMSEAAVQVWLDLIADTIMAEIKHELESATSPGNATEGTSGEPA